MNECCSNKKKLRDSSEKKLLDNRLSRIEGQVRGLRKMLEEDCYCTDILTQTSAVQAALNAFNRELLVRHLKTCVVDNIRAGDDSVVDELAAALQKLMK